MAIVSKTLVRVLWVSSRIMEPHSGSCCSSLVVFRNEEEGEKVHSQKRGLLLDFLGGQNCGGMRL